MSKTKDFSIDGCGTSEDEFWRGYEESFPDEPFTDEDLVAIAAQEARRIKDAEAEVGRCGQREDW
jgi:hypothetical protein